jgi:hypothetical protein
MNLRTAKPVTHSSSIATIGAMSTIRIRQHSPRGKSVPDTQLLNQIKKGCETLIPQPSNYLSASF